jgi:hypothetical protein
MLCAMLCRAMLCCVPCHAVSQCVVCRAVLCCAVSGEEPHSGIVASISSDNPALVTCVDDERLEFQVSGKGEGI